MDPNNKIEKIETNPSLNLDYEFMKNFYSSTYPVENNGKYKCCRLYRVKMRDNNVFAKEIEALGCLRHPNIVSVYGYGAFERAGSFLIIERIEVCLGDLIIPTNTKPKKFPQMSLPSKLNILLGVAKGLQYLHTPIYSSEEEINKPVICHGALNLRNIIVRKNFSGLYDAKLLDFGLHNTFRIIQILSPQIRELILKAPEILPTHPQFGDSSAKTYTDIYHFGMVTYQLLTEMNPFFTDCTGEFTAHIRNGNIPDLSVIQYEGRVLPNLYRIMQACWEYDPTQRPSSSELVTMLQDAIMTLML